MSRLSVAPTDRIKPGRWAISPGLIDPQWRWIWRKAVLAITIRPGDHLNEFDFALKELSVTNGNPTKGTDAFLGGSSLICDGTDDAIEWSNGRIPDSYDDDISLGVVAQLASTGTERRIVGTSAAVNGGWALSYLSNEIFVLTKGGRTNVQSAITLPANVPLFLAASYRKSDGLTNFVVKRLDTAALTTATATDTQIPINGDGIFYLGGARVFSANMHDGPVSMGMIVTEYSPMDQLIAWSIDPFGPFRMARRRIAAAVGNPWHVYAQQ